MRTSACLCGVRVCHRCHRDDSQWGLWWLGAKAGLLCSPRKWIFMGKQPSGVVSENSEAGGSLGSTAHSGGADAVIQRQLDKFAPTRQTCGWQRDSEGAVKKSESPEKEWND